MANFLSSFGKSLIDPNLTDAAIEVVESSLDDILDCPAVDDIPVLRSIIGIGKTIVGIRERNLLRQTSQFITTFNAGTIPEEDLNRYQSEMLSDPKKIQNELERVLLLLDATLDVEKSELLARFYRAYVMRAITWETFRELSEVINQLVLEDLRTLEQIAAGVAKTTEECGAHRAWRLSALGLVIVTTETYVYPGEAGNQYLVELSDLGRTFHLYSHDVTEEGKRTSSR